MTFSFLEVLFFFSLTLVSIYCLGFQRSTVYKYKLQRKLIMKKIQIDINFHLPLILMLKNPTFFLYSESSFMNIFLEAIKQPICRGVSLINFKVFFSSEHRLEISLDVWKVKHLIWYIYQFQCFLNHSVRVCVTKLKTDMPHHVNNTFQNTIF